MNAQFVDSFIAAKGSMFAAEQLEEVRNMLLNAPDSKEAAVTALNFKNPTTILIGAIFGCYGVDRFMMGEVGLGIAKIITCGGCWIWWIVDMISAMKRARQYNYNALASAL